MPSAPSSSEEYLNKLRTQYPFYKGLLARYDNCTVKMLTALDGLGVVNPKLGVAHSNMHYLFGNQVHKLTNWYVESTYTPVILCDGPARMLKDMPHDWPT